MLRAVALAVAILAGAPAPPAQAPAPGERRVRDLLVLIDGPDVVSAQDAAVELVRLGPAVQADVVTFLRTRTSCSALWLASNVLARLGLEPALVELKWLGIAGGDCAVRRVQDREAQAEAAYAVVDRPRGLDVMVRLLRGRDLWGHQRAAQAVRRLTERLAAGPPAAVEATPELVSAVREILPVLRDVVESTRPEMEARCVALDALERARDLPQEPIRTRAREVAGGLRLDCRAVNAPLTGREQEAGWRRVIARLDTQTPEAASRTASMLLANLAEARPHLLKRLGETNRCRGLALVAGVLASQDAAAPDVEAAYVRVLEGRCEGREPFDLALAQGVADVFLRDAAGVARVTALLAHDAVEVRRRAAQAFAQAFERLGPGEHGAAGAPGAALVAAMRAALAPLVTFAQGERDEAARCQGVRALLFAQQAVHDALRADAAAATTGRTLRCLAPPTR